jgi:hypothetical protein
MDYYARGKIDRIEGKPLVEPLASAGELARYDYRCGYRVADVNLREHPEWSREFILLETPPMQKHVWG